MAEPRFDVTTIGEMLMRLSVPPGQRLEVATGLDLFPAGAEGNVVTLLARLHHRCAWLGSLPDHALGRLVANHLRMAGVDLSGVVWNETGRLGIYFVEFAMPPRSSQVIYDRTNSCAAHLRPEQVDWSLMLDTRLIHLTGITPALSPGCQALAAEAIRRARAAGIAVSFDINYRQKLWSEAEAQATLSPLIDGVDLLFCSRADAGRLFDCRGTPQDIVRQLAEQTHAHQVVITLGEQGAVAWDGNHLWQEPARPVHMLDRLGAGDALAAGVIHGWLEGSLAQGLRYGVALAALALSQHGDSVVTTREELAAILAGSGEGVVR